MKLRTLLVLAALIVVSRGLQAQMVVTPDPKLTSEQAVVSDALYRLRDTLLVIESATARFGRDRMGASDQALQSRARVIAGRCRAATPLTESVHKIVATSGIPAGDLLGARARLEKSMLELHGKLEWCSAEFDRLAGPPSARELRDYGIGRGKQVDVATQDYVVRMQAFLHAGLGARYKPYTRNAGASPSGANH